MALPKGVKRYQHLETGEIRYFRNTPDNTRWVKVGTPGSKNWRWIHNAIEERYVASETVVPEGYSLGRLKA